MLWKLFYQLKGVKGLNEVIKSIPRISMSNKDAKNFLKVYLDRPFDSSAEEPFLIFDFLDDYVYEKGDYEFFESLMMGSKYFETIPVEKVTDALDCFAHITTWDCNTEAFSKYLISKITDSKILLEYNFWYVAGLYDCYSGLGFEDKLLELGVDYAISLSEELDYSDSRKLLSFYKSHILLKEFVTLCQKGDFSVKDIFDNVLHNYDTSELDTLFDIIINKVELKNAVIDTRRKRTISVFEQFLDELNRREKITEQHKNYLAEKLLETKNYPRMLDWLANIDCETNKKLIVPLIGNVTEFTLLNTISNKYVLFAVKMILEQGEVNSMGINTVDAIFLGQYDNEKLESILDSLYKINPNIKFSKKTTMYLLKLGVNKFATLINAYELTDAERLEILQALKEINSDWLIIYGAYLVSGDGFALMLDYVADEQMRRIRELKSSSEEM